LSIHKEEVEKTLFIESSLTKEELPVLEGMNTHPVNWQLNRSAFKIDVEHYMELSTKPVLELEEKLELKKYNLARHYGVDPNKITPKFVKTFDREKPRTIWYNTVKALPIGMKLHDGVRNWCNRSSWEIMNSTDLKCQSPNIIMCLLVMDGLNDVVPPKLLTGASEAEIRGANIALKNVVNSEVQPGNGEANVLKFTESIDYFAGANTLRPVLERPSD